MSNSRLTKLIDRELQDLTAKLRFALVSIALLPPLGATLTTLGVPRAFAAVVLFAGFALLLCAFVVARASEKITTIQARAILRGINEKITTIQVTAILGAIIDVGLMLLGLGIIAAILIGPTVIANLVEILKRIGDSGFILPIIAFILIFLLLERRTLV